MKMKTTIMVVGGTTDNAGDIVSQRRGAKTHAAGDWKMYGTI